MKWVNHEIISASTMIILSHDLISTAFVMAGSIFPDWIEGRPNFFNYQTWRKNHRGISHLLLIYFMLFCGIAAYYKYRESTYSMYALYVVFGAILHILQDSICGKVPFYSVKKKIGIQLFTVGSFQEYCLSAVFVLFASVCILK